MPKNCQGPTPRAETTEVFRRPELGCDLQHLPLEPLHQVLGDVKKISGPTGRVEYARLAKPAMEILDKPESGLGIASVARLLRCRQDIAPVVAQRCDHGFDHQALDIGARRVVRPQPRALGRLQRLFEQGAEDGGVDQAPVMLGGGEQLGDAVPAEREHLRLGEHAAVEALQLGTDGRGVAAFVHGAPEIFEQRLEALRRFQAFAQQPLEAVGRDQADILGEHGEDAAHQEQRDILRIVPALQRLRDGCEALGDLACCLGRLAGRVERVGIAPDACDPGPDGGIAQIFEIDPEAVPVGELGVVLPLPGEVRIELEAVADIAEDDEGRPAMRGGQSAAILFGLALGVQHHHVEAAIGAASSAQRTGPLVIRIACRQDFLGLAFQP